MKRKSEFIGNICDLHSHVLPGLDDGPQDMDESAAMLKTAQREGIGVIAATPHLVLDGTHYDYLAHAEKALDELCYRQKTDGIDITILPGAELFLDENIFECRPEEFTIGRSSVLLFEADKNCGSELLLETIRWLLDRKMVPLIAHPERYSDIDSLIPNLKVFGDIGLCLQINSSSILGKSGLCVMRRAKTLVKTGIRFVLGSDAHSMETRPPIMQASLCKLKSWIGSERAMEAAITLPGALLNL